MANPFAGERGGGLLGALAIDFDGGGLLPNWQLAGAGEAGHRPEGGRTELQVRHLALAAYPLVRSDSHHHAFRNPLDQTQVQRG